MSFDLAQILTIVVGVILPLVVGLVAKTNATSGIKAVALLALSGVSGFLSNWLDAVTSHATFTVGTVFLSVLSTFLVGVGSYFGIWKATVAPRIAGKLGVIGPRTTK